MTKEEWSHRCLPSFKFWEPVPTEVYDAIYDRYRELQAKHPGLAGHNILMYIACEITMGIAKGEIPNPHDRS